MTVDRSSAGERDLEFRSADHAWEFFGDLVRREHPRLVAIAQQELRRKGLAWSASESEDLVHDAVVHLVGHVVQGTARIRPHPGILVQEIRHRAQRVRDREDRRRTTPDPFDGRSGPIAARTMVSTTTPEDAAIERAVLEEVYRRRAALVRSISALARTRRIGPEQWEALQTVEDRGRSPHEPRVRKRASRCRTSLWPVVSAWITGLSHEPVDGTSADRLSAVLHGTGIIRLSWWELLHADAGSTGAASRPVIGAGDGTAEP